MNVYENLCAYDPKNPNRVLLDEYPPFPNANCSCDNCFYGRTPMAERLISLSEVLEPFIDKNDPTTGGIFDPKWEDFERVKNTYYKNG
jgi:hypothetical protein